MKDNAQKLLNYLVEKAKNGNIIAGDPRTYLGYKEVLQGLGLRHIADTYGRSLEIQGLRELAEWIEQKKLPAITGLIIDKESSMPSKGYFDVYKKNRDTDFQWWKEQIEASLSFNWIQYINSSNLETLNDEDGGEELEKSDVRNIVNTYLLTWNPENWIWDDLAELSLQVRSGVTVEKRWSCRSTQVKLGDRVFFIKQGSEPRGIFASGTCVEESFKDKHYSPEKQDKLISYIGVKFDTLIDPSSDPILSVSDIIPSHFWRTQVSGINLPDEIVVALEDLWSSFVNQTIEDLSLNNREIDRGAGYGSYENNKLVEEAAIQAVTNMYRLNGWKVQSVERDRCGFDLICVRSHERNDVEVKGVSGSDCNFILTYGELEQAKINEKFMLCVVTNARSEPTIQTFTGSEFISKFNIVPVQYRASIQL